MQAHHVAIHQLAVFPTQLQAVVTRIDHQALVATPILGEWSIAQNVHHLADSHSTAFARCRLILTEQNPPLKPYDQDAWAALADSRNPDIGPSLLILQGLHQRWAAFFAQLDDTAWERTGQHAEAGAMTLASILHGYVAHGHAHIAQIERTLAAYQALQQTA